MKLREMGKRIAAGMLAGMLTISSGSVPASTVMAEELAAEEMEKAITADEGGGELEEEASGEIVDGESDSLEDGAPKEEEPEDQAENLEENTVGEEIPEEPQEIETEEQESAPDQEPVEPTGSAEQEAGSETIEETDMQPDAVAKPEEMVQTAEEAVEQTGDIDSGTDWTLDADGKLTIRSDRGMTKWQLEGAYKTQVKSVEMQDGVTSIDDYAFYEYSNLTNITLPSSLTSIGDGAFVRCGLTDITIPSGVTSIGRQAFVECRKLTSVTLSSGLTSIGDGAFWDCRSLTDITIPSGVISIGSEAFRECSKLTSVTLPSSVKSIGDGAFVWCGLTDITIPSGSIGREAFSDCEKLTSVTLLSGVDSIGDHAFGGCMSLTDITLPSSVKSIGDYAFSVCDLTDITIPSGSIGERVFYHCENLKSVTLLSGVTSIGEYAFDSCCSLTSITLPSSLTSIGNYAFFNCSKLASIEIPSGVKRIGDYAFYCCSSLESVIMQGATPPRLSNISVGTIKTYTFDNCKFVVSYSKGIKVPVGTTEIYKDEWTEWADYIVEEGASEENVPVEGLDWTIDAHGRLVIRSDAGMADWLNASRKNYRKVLSVEIQAGVTSIPEDSFADCKYLTDVTSLSGVANIGNRAFYGYNRLTNITISSRSIGKEAFCNCGNLKSVTLLSGVDSIGDGAFGNCISLTDITLPSGVTSIGSEAFRDCRNLASVTIPSGVASIGDSMFANCSSLTNITIPSSVTSIGDGAFWDCSSLTDITLPSGVISIGSEAFRECRNLASVTLPSGVDSIGDGTFASCSSLTDITLPSSVTSIGDGAFSSCSKLTSVTIPSGVTSIGDGAFWDCSSLTDITLPFGVRSIGEHAFSSCGKLISVTLPSGVRSIGEHAFSSCSKLTSVTIPSGVTSIGDGTFASCSSLTDITLPSGVRSIGKEAFYNCSRLTRVMLPSSVDSIGDYAFAQCGLTDIVIPSGVRSIGEHAFSSCSKLTSVTLLSSVDSIGNHAFYNCSSLTDITLLPGVTSIGNGMFAYCSSLTGITLPSSVTSIEPSAFSGCSSLKRVTMLGTTPPMLDEKSYVFLSCKFQQEGTKGIKVPVGTVEAYKTAWLEWADYITEIRTLTDSEKVDTAKQAVEAALAEIQIANTITEVSLGTAIKDAIKETLEEADVNSDDITIAVEDFIKRDATISAEGSITATIKITSGMESASVPVDKTIEKLPVTPADKVAAAKAVVEDAVKSAVDKVLAGTVVTNDNAEEAAAKIREVLSGAIAIALEEAGVSVDEVEIGEAGVEIKPATTDSEGSINISIPLTSKEDAKETDRAVVQVPITKPGGEDAPDKPQVTPAEKMAAAKAAVEAAVKKAVETVLAGITVTNDNVEETAVKMKEAIPDAVAGALEEANVSADEILVGEVDVEIKPATTDSEGSIDISIPLTSKEDAGETDRVIFQVPVAKPEGEDDSEKDVEAAQKMVEDALKEIAATNKTTEEEILVILKEKLGDKAAVGGIEKFEKQDATQEAPGSISLSVKVTINGKTIMIEATVPIAQLAARKTGVYVRFMDYYDMDGATPRYKYTGLAVKPVVEVYNNETLLTPGTDYTIGYKNNTKVGAAAALTVKGKGSFSGTSNVVNFAIINADIDQDTAHPTEMTVVVNTKVAPVIMNGTKKLTTKDFQLEGAGLANGKYAAATGEGNPNTLTVKGIGSYAGSSFEIKVRVIEKSAAQKLAVMVDKSFKPVYSGNALNVSTLIQKTQGGEGAITVTDAKDRAKILKEGTDFSVLCTSSLSNAGTVKFTVTGMGEYTGSVNKSFKINPLKVGDSSRFSVVFDENKTYEYRPSGTTVDDLVVTYLGETNSTEDDKILAQGVDYKVTYSNHKKVSGTKDAAFKVTFLGNYKGSSALPRTFKIAAAKLSADNTMVIVPDQVYTSGNRAYKSSPIVTVDGAAIKASNYTVSYAWAAESEAGNEAKYISDNQVKVTLAQGDTYAKVKVTITPKQTGSYILAEGAVLTGEYYVRKADNAVNLSKAKVTFLNKAGTQLKALEYNGNAFYTPTGNRPETDHAADDLNAVYVKVAVGGVEVDPGLYDLVWINATEKGKATVVICGKGIDTGNGLAVGSKNQTIQIKAMALKGRTLQSLVENTVNAVDSLKSIF